MTEGSVAGALRGSLDGLREILDAVDAGVIIRDGAGNLLYANYAAAKLTGYTSPEALIAAGPDEPAQRFEIMDESGQSLSLSDLPTRRVPHGDAVSEVVLRWRDVDGSDRWSSVRTTQVFDDAGSLSHVVVVFRDITAQRQVEAGRRRFAFLAEASNVLASSLDYEVTLATVSRLAVPHLADWCSVHIVDEAGVVRQLAVAHVDPNKVAYARELEKRYPYDPNSPYGVPRVMRTRQSELTPDISQDILDAADVDDELREILRQLQLTSTMIVPLVARDRVLGAITFVSAESGHRYGEDDLKLAEDLASRAALAVDNARLYAESTRTVAEQATILQHMTDGVLLVDSEGVVRYINQAARGLLGMDPVGLPISDLLDSVEPESVDGILVSGAESTIVRALQGEPALNVDRRIRHADGRELVVRVSAAPVQVAGDTLGVVAVLNDITGAWDLERQKDAFLAAAAHDLKTPLTTVKGLSQMLQRRVERDEPERMVQGLEQIDRAATRMNRLVNELLDATRFQMGVALDLSARPGDLVALVRRVADEFGRPNQNRIGVVATVPELIGVWDLDRLERVVANLLSNALKYSPGGGPISVTVSRDGGALVVVEDSGVGIPADELPYIFQRFYRGRNVDATIPGTGLGLYGVKHIVERHGGTIEVESREGEGSIFTLRLPLSPVIAPAAGR